MFCSQCSKIIKDGSKFCKYCGATQEVHSAISEFHFDKYKKQGWGHNSGVLVGLIGVACIAILLYVVGNYHECDWCKKQYIGSAYYNAWDSEEIMCEDCARQYYMGLDYTRFRVE